MHTYASVSVTYLIQATFSELLDFERFAIIKMTPESLKVICIGTIWYIMHNSVLVTTFLSCTELLALAYGLEVNMTLNNPWCEYSCRNQCSMIQHWLQQVTLISVQCISHTNRISSQVMLELTLSASTHISRLIIITTNLAAKLLSIISMLIGCWFFWVTQYIMLFCKTVKYCNSTFSFT